MVDAVARRSVEDGGEAPVVSELGEDCVVVRRGTSKRMAVTAPSIPSWSGYATRMEVRGLR